MILTIMAYLQNYTLLYQVCWYYCSKQQLKKNHSKLCCDVIVEDKSIIRVVFDKMRNTDYDSASKFKVWCNSSKSHIAAKYGVRRYSKPNAKHSVEYHSSIATSMQYIPFLFHLHTFKLTELQLFKYQGHLATFWPWPLTYDIEKSRLMMMILYWRIPEEHRLSSRSPVSSDRFLICII